MAIQIKKFWTVRDNIIGTAHINRKGETVDFRPGKTASTIIYVGFPPDDRRSLMSQLVLKDQNDSTMSIHSTKIEVLEWELTDDMLPHWTARRVLKAIAFFEVERVEIQIPLDGSKPGALQILMAMSPEEQARSNEISRKNIERARVERDNRKKEATDNALKLESRFFLELTGQEKKWLRRFLSDPNASKAWQQVEATIYRFDFAEDWFCVRDIYDVGYNYETNIYTDRAKAAHNRFHFLIKEFMENGLIGAANKVIDDYPNLQPVERGEYHPLDIDFWSDMLCRRAFSSHPLTGIIAIAAIRDALALRENPYRIGIIQRYLQKEQNK